MRWIVFILLIGASISSCVGQRIPPPPQSFINNLNNPPQSQNASGPGGLNLQLLQQQQQQQKTDELANIKDENIKKVLTDLSSLQTPTQAAETMQKVANMVGPLFFANYDARQSQISRDSPDYPQRLISAVTDIQGEEVKALMLQRKLDQLHASDFAFLPLAIQYGFQDDVLGNLTGTKLASVVKVNPGDTVVAFKVASALVNKPEEQIEFLQSVGFKLLPQVQRIIMSQVLQWWGDPHTWKDRELNLLTTAGTPLLAYLPQSQLQSLDDELADRFVTILGQTQDIARGWWRKPMSLKKAWFEVAKGARYFGAVHEWSFRRMQKLSFLLEGATPEDLELIPPVPEIKGLVIGNHYTELQARVVFDAFYNSPPLSQEDLQEFQFHVLDLTPSQLQRFDFADSFGTLDEMMAILDRQPDPSYPTVLQISYFMWPIVNGTNGQMSIAPPATWQKRELAQIGKLFFLLPKSVLSQIPDGVINWDSNTLAAIRSNHLTHFQIWKLTAEILVTVDDRFKPDYIFMIPAPYQAGIPSQNISQALLGSVNPRPEVLRSLIEQAPGMLISQQAVILQRISNRLAEANVVRTMVGSGSPEDLFNLINPRVLSKNMGSIIKTIMEMPETGRFGITSIQTKLLPRNLLSLWLKWVRENGQVTTWSAEDLLGRSPLGAQHELGLGILGLTCREIELVDPWDILSVIMHYRHELYALRRFKTSLSFNVDLRSCTMGKVIEYLKQKHFLSGNQTDTHVLTGISVGETEALGGEILSIIPPAAIDPLDIDTRLNIIKEIGQLQMQELFSLSTLDNLRFYAKTLFRDMAVSTNTGPDISSQRRKRQAPNNATAGTPDQTANTTTTQGANSTGDSAATNAPASAPSGADITRALDNSAAVPLDPTVAAGTGNAGAATGVGGAAGNTAAPPPAPAGPVDLSKLQQHGIDLQALTSMGNLICFAENLFDANWPRALLKEVLESKTSIGEKTCCLSKALRDKWFDTLKTVYGADTSSWNEFDIAAIGDLLIALPDADLQKISTDVLGKAVTPLMRQSAWAIKIFIPGQIKKIEFVTACSEALGTEGQEFMGSYKNLMKRFFQASQWMVNTVKSTPELIRDGVSRSGRIPRWAEHTLVKRQIPMTMTGGDMSFGGLATSPTMVYQTTTPTFGMQPQASMGYVAYAPTPQYSPMMTAYNQQQPMMTTFGQQQPMMYNMQPSSQVYMMPAQQQMVPAFGTVAAQPGMVGTGTTAGATTATGAAGTAGAAAGAGGGSFAQAGTATGTGTGFDQGGSFAQGTADTSQAGGGSFSQANTNANAAANANTLAARSAGNNQQQQQQSQQQQQPQQTQQQQGPASNPAPPPQTGPTPVTSSSGLQGAAQPGPAQGSQPPGQPQTGASPAPPGQPQGGNPPGQPQAGAPPGQPQAGAPPGQPQAGAPPGQPQAGAPPGQPQAGAPPGQPQAGAPPGQPQAGAPPGQPPAPIPAVPSGQLQSAGQAPPQGGNTPGQQPGIPGGIPGGRPSPFQDLRTRALNLGAPLQDDTHNSEITCHGIKAAGSAAIGLSIDDLNKLSQADLFDCVEALGRIEWDEDTKSQIMTLLKQKLEFNKDAINALTLIELGDLVTAFSAKDDGTGTAATATANATVHSDISMIDLTLPNSLDMLGVLGEQVNEQALLKSMAEKFNQDNKIFPGFSEGIARPENLRIVVMSLGNVICGLNDKIVNSIFETDASLFVDTSRILGRLEGCGQEVLTTLAAHAVRPSNYGPPRLWSQEDLETIGVVFAGLKPDLISTIPADAMQGLTALAVKNLPATSITAFTPEQLQKMSFSAAMAFTHIQSNNFSPAEAEAIKSVLQVSPDLFTVAATVLPAPIPVTPPPTTPPPAAPDDTLVTRGLQEDAQPDSDIGGRARNREGTIPPEVLESPEPTEATTTPPPATEAPTSSASSSKVPSIWRVDYIVTLLAVIISVIYV